MSSSTSTPFDAEKVQMHDVHIQRLHIQNPIAFNHETLKGIDCKHNLLFFFNLERKLVRADFEIKLQTQSANPEEAVAEATLSFFFTIFNYAELIEMQEKAAPKVHPHLLYSLTGVAYSTARGILLERLRGSVFKGYVLPVADPVKMIRNLAK